jgi:flagellar M-ring protein FliF
MTRGSLMPMVEQMSSRQRIVGGLALVAAAAAFFAILRIAMAPSMSLLYSGLDPAAAGEVVQSLEQQGAQFEVRGGAIFVDSRRRDSLRMTLAAEGKPANGTAGYELLDSLSGFGTTSQMFDVAYWRAKEGELSRTIMSSPQVRSARVHISNAENRPFAQTRAMSASVSVLPSSGTIAPEQAAAFRFLVASAVAGLEPDGVAVIDVRSGEVVSGDREDLARGGDRRAEELRRRAERLLEARVGRGNAVVEVSVETVTDREQIRERTLDPDSRVLISNEVEERALSATGTGSAAVTVASNLPDGDAGANAPQSASDETESRERSNFEVSETTRDFVRGPGGIQRITVAVLVNESVPAADGTTVPRPVEELTALRDLVASAIGINEARGDVVTIQAMSFSSPELLVGEAGSVIDALLAGIDVMRIIQLAVLAAVALVLALFVVKPILAAAARAPQDIGRLPNFAGEQAGVAGPQRAIAALPMPAPGGSPDAAQRLVRAVGARQSETVNVLRDWMKPGGNNA